MSILVVYLGRCQTFMMEFFVKTVNSFEALTILAKKLYHRCLTNNIVLGNYASAIFTAPQRRVTYLTLFKPKFYFYTP